MWSGISDRCLGRAMVGPCIGVVGGNQVVGYGRGDCIVVEAQRLLHGQQ